MSFPSVAAHEDARALVPIDSMARNPILGLIWLVLLVVLAWPIAAACAAVSANEVDLDISLDVFLCDALCNPVSLSRLFFGYSSGPETRFGLSFR